MLGAEEGKANWSHCRLAGVGVSHLQSESRAVLKKPTSVFYSLHIPGPHAKQIEGSGPITSG